MSFSTSTGDPAAKPARTGNKMASKRNKQDDAPRRTVLRKRSALNDFSIINYNYLSRHALYLQRVVWRYQSWSKNEWTRQRRSVFALGDCCKKARQWPKLHPTWVLRGKLCTPGSRSSMRVELTRCARCRLGVVRPDSTIPSVKTCVAPSCKSLPNTDLVRSCGGSSVSVWLSSGCTASNLARCKSGVSWARWALTNASTCARYTQIS